MAIHPSIQTAADQFGVGEAWLQRAIDGLSDEELRRRPGNSNPLLWIIGHVGYYHAVVANILGGERDKRWPELFAGGAEKADPSVLPSLEELLAERKLNTTAMEQAFETAGEELLSSPFERDFPTRDKSTAGAVSFLALHDGHHAGQMLYLRKWLGK